MEKSELTWLDFQPEFGAFTNRRTIDMAAKQGSCIFTFRVRLHIERDADVTMAEATQAVQGGLVSNTARRNLLLAEGEKLRCVIETAENCGRQHLGREDDEQDCQT